MWAPCCEWFKEQPQYEIQKQRNKEFIKNWWRLVIEE